MGLADIHIHSLHSWDGTATISAILKYASTQANLDVIAITDHDKVRGSLEALELAGKYGIGVIPGSEVTTANGHLLALFIQQPIPRGLPLVETVLRIRESGGLCVAAHPEARGSHSLSLQSIRLARENPQVADTLIGVETLNASLLTRGSQMVARELAAEQGLAWLGNSDAHTLSMIGTGASLFPGKTTEDFRKALIQRTTRVYHPQEQSALKIITHWTRGFVLRRAGWVAWNPAPEQPVVLGRTARVGLTGITPQV